MENNKRTISQNNSIHLYCEQVAEVLNDAGYDIAKVIKHAKIDIPWTKESVKEILWKTIQKSMFNKSSTTELNKNNEITEIWEVINRFLAKLEIESIPFPSIDEIKIKK
jgi:hypothetical protein